MASPSGQQPKLLRHQLVARDARSSYIQRVHTLAGPGAYVIPSTFKQKQTPQKERLRDIQQRQYGREFARKQRLTEGDSDGGGGSIHPLEQMCVDQE